MTIEERVLIAGAGPVGLVAAANLVRSGVPVTVLEAGSDLSEDPRASTFHPPTLDMLDRLGAAQPLIAQGLVAPAFQYRSRQHGVLAQFDFAAITDVTAHPYRVQAEQSKLTRILYEQLRGQPGFELEFGAQVRHVTQHPSGVEIAIERRGQRRRGPAAGSSAPTAPAATSGDRSVSSSMASPGRSAFSS